MVVPVPAKAPYLARFSQRVRNWLPIACALLERALIVTCLAILSASNNLAGRYLIKVERYRLLLILLMCASHVASIAAVCCARKHVETEALAASKHQAGDTAAEQRDVEMEQQMYQASRNVVFPLA